MVKIYIETEKKVWKQRYSLQAGVKAVGAFLDEETTPEEMHYTGGALDFYRVKPSACRFYAPIGYKVFEMIRLSEQDQKSPERFVSNFFDLISIIRTCMQRRC